MDDLTDGVASVRFLCDDKARLRGRWAFALIIKTFGRNVGFHFLQSKIMALWKLVGYMECIDLEYEFYLVRFGLVEDYKKVLREGPWFIGDQFLSIRAWEPNFKPFTVQCSSVAVWVRFLELPIEYYEQMALKEIGQAIGPVLRIDTHTAFELWGHFAHICVQVNLDNPLIRTIMIGKFAQPVIYEGLNTLCFAYGRVGHKREAYPYMVHEETPKKDISTPSPPSPTREATSEAYGPWTLVSRRKERSSKSRPYHGPKAQFPNPRKGDTKSFPSSRSPSVGPGMPKERTHWFKMTLFSTPALHIRLVRWDMTLLCQVTKPKNNPHLPLPSRLVNPIPQKTHQTLKLLLPLNTRPTPTLTRKNMSKVASSKGKEKSMDSPETQEWGIFYKGKIIVISSITIAEIKATPTYIMGWFEEELMKAWSHIFSFTPES